VTIPQTLLVFAGACLLIAAIVIGLAFLGGGD
jgi:hypothetical protein